MVISQWGKLSSESFSGCVAAPGLGREEWDSDLGCGSTSGLSVLMLRQACRKEAGGSSGLSAVVEGGAVQTQKPNPPWAGGRGHLEWGVLFGLQHIFFLGSGARQSWLCRACPGPLTFLGSSQSLSQCWDRMTLGLPLGPGSEAPADPRVRKGGGGSRWRSVAPHTFLLKEEVWVTEACSASRPGLHRLWQPLCCPSLPPHRAWFLGSPMLLPLPECPPHSPHLAECPPTFPAPG